MRDPNPAQDDPAGSDMEAKNSSQDVPGADADAELRSELDALLDEIDEPLEEGTEEFVRKYVQKGGQGWSGLLDPSFFVGAAAASLAAAMVWDTFKTVIGRVVHALQNVPGPVTPDALLPDGSLNPEFEELLHEAWWTAERLLKGKETGPLLHSMDEATALHWVIFFTEMQKAQGLVRLRPDHYKHISQAAAATPERLSPSQLVARIVDRWLRENPMADRGIAD